jgi:hypothetical protein
MKAEDKYIHYLNEIMQDHWENNKSLYREDGEETPEWKKVNRMNNKIMWIVRDYFDDKKSNKEPLDPKYKKKLLTRLKMYKISEWIAKNV